MNWSVKGSDGPNSPRSSGVSSEEKQTVPLDAKLSGILAQQGGKISVAVRQGEGKDVPLDGGKTAKRMMDTAEAMGPMRAKAAGLWEKFKAGLHSFAQLLHLVAKPVAGDTAVRPMAERITTDLELTPESRNTLQREIGKFREDPTTFLRNGNAFSTQMALGLKARVDGAPMGQVMATLGGGGVPPSGLDYTPSRATDEAVQVLVDLASRIMDGVMGTETTPSIARQLPESWLTGLRDAAREIDRSDLSHVEKDKAVRTLVTDSVFLRFVAPELSLGTTNPGRAAANTVFMVLVKEASGKTLSPELKEAIAPLREVFSQKLDGFIRDLDLRGPNG